MQITLDKNKLTDLSPAAVQETGVHKATGGPELTAHRVRLVGGCGDLKTLWTLWDDGGEGPLHIRARPTRVWGPCSGRWQAHATLY
jgi:hypothetical protein